MDSVIRAAQVTLVVRRVIRWNGRGLRDRRDGSLKVVRDSLKAVCVNMLFVAILSAADVPGQEATIENLVKAVPVLSINNEQLSSFRFKCETLFPFEVPFIIDFAWAKPDTFGMLVSRRRRPNPGHLPLREDLHDV